MRLLGKTLSHIAASFGMTLETCAEQIDLSACGIEHGRCIDDALMSAISGKRFEVFTELHEAVAYVRAQGAPIVVKADGTDSSGHRTYSLPSFLMILVRSACQRASASSLGSSPLMMLCSSRS